MNCEKINIIESDGGEDLEIPSCFLRLFVGDSFVLAFDFAIQTMTLEVTPRNILIN